MDIIALYVGEAIVVGAIAFARYLRGRRDDDVPKLLSETEVVPIKGAAHGTVQHIAGRLRLAGDRPLTAPLSGRPCAYFELSIEEWEQGEQSSGWAMRHFDWGAQDFIIEDDSGASALVQAQQLSVALDIDAKSKTKVFREMPEELERLLDRVAVEHGVMVRNRRRVCAYEGVLEAGEEIDVYGMCRWEADAEGAGYRDAASRLVVSAPAGQRLLLTDML